MYSRGMTRLISAAIAIAITIGRPNPTPSKGLRKTKRPMISKTGDEKSRIPRFKPNEDQPCR